MLRFSRLIHTVMALVVALLVVACGGGGEVPATGVALRPLSAEFTSRKAVSYSPFRSANRDTETVTAANVKQDLQLLVAGGFRLIRLFDSSDAVAKLTLQVIKDNGLDLKVMLGIYVVKGNDAFNQAEIARGIALANAHRDLVLAVSVGNETMVNWSFNPITPAVMAGFLTTVRNAVTQPVTTDDNWAFYASAPRAILDAIDFAAVHTYPLLDSIYNAALWDWQQVNVPPANRATAMMDAAVAATRKDYGAVRTYLDSIGKTAMPIVIGETGWKAVASGGEVSRAHPVNQKMYVDRLQVWGNEFRTTGTGPAAIFYFEAFDEPWKQADDKWGLFNVNRQARYVVQGLYPATLWEPGTYTAADALYHIPLTGNGTVTASRYTLYANTVTLNEARPAEAAVWNAWDNGTTGFASEVTTTADPTDLASSAEVMPKPASWGWGLAMALPTTAEDLSQFGATGKLNFSIKTTYPGAIEVGFLTGSASSGSAYDVYLAIRPGEYGYQNDGNWHTVSIPISAITARGAMAFGMTDAAKARLDLTKVTNPFVIADRYASTGKAQNSGHTTRLYVDAIHWSR